MVNSNQKTFGFGKRDSSRKLSRQQKYRDWSFKASTITFSDDPDCVGLTLDGTLNRIAIDNSGICIAFDSVQRLKGPHILENVICNQ